MIRLICLTLAFAMGALAAEPGGDVAAVFARAKEGAPLRYVALGGSITQAGKGWIGGWLREQFPRSDVSAVNAGWSGTGSQLGVFRLERDVIAHQPDLVAIEFCVNDLGTPDDETIRNLETIIVRLKQLPHPPAIFFIFAAKHTNPDIQRHRKVARHYGLLEIDLQPAVEEHLKKNNLPWSAFFNDEVHPNEAGHAFYAKKIEEHLAPLLDARPPEAAPLPAPLSTRPLLLDATMVPLNPLDSPGWKRESYLPFWWNFFFQGYLSSEKPGASLVLPWRGTTFGLLFAALPKNGYVLSSVDGAFPMETPVFLPLPLAMFADGLPAREHRTVLVQHSGPGVSDLRPAVLAYALIAGGSKASAGKSPQGEFSPEVLRALRFTPLTAKDWAWARPFPQETKDGADLKTALPVEKSGDAARWNPAPAHPDAWIDLLAIPGIKEPGMACARMTLDAPRAGRVLARLEADYYARLTVNGKEVKTLDQFHGSPHAPVLFPVDVREGPNEFLLKISAGSRGFGFSLSASDLLPTPAAGK